VPPFLLVFSSLHLTRIGHLYFAGIGHYYFGLTI
jgi:hypothetical protein